jgi:co-chaperonin GroES (HSP10)
MTLPYKRAAHCALLVFCCAAVFAQVPERMVGTVASIAPDKSTLEIKGQDGQIVTVHLTAETILQRVAPGEKSLKNAETIQAADIAQGDKVLVNSDSATASARRLVVMPAAAIAKHDEADRMAWTTQGVSGIVAVKTGDDLTLRLRSMQGDTQAHVIVSAATRFRKYTADSVRYSDAKASSLAEVQAGDQLRARGDKSADGLKVTADEIVFGTFVTKAGTITAIDADHKSVAIKELNTNKPFNVKLTTDSQLKQMPDFGAMFAGGMPEGGTPPSVAGGGGMRPLMMGGGKVPDLAQMIERMPSLALNAVKVGDTVVMSSTKGAVENEYTAIILLDKADMLIRMATTQRGGQNGASGAAGGAAGMQQMGGMQGAGGMGGGLGNLELPSIMQ